MLQESLLLLGASKQVAFFGYSGHTYLPLTQLEAFSFSSQQTPRIVVKIIILQ
jgi:hypothetical protein